MAAVAPLCSQFFFFLWWWKGTMGKHLIWQSQNNDFAKLWLCCVCLWPPLNREAWGNAEQRLARGQRRDVTTTFTNEQFLTVWLVVYNKVLFLFFFLNSSTQRSHYVKFLSSFLKKPWLWRIVGHWNHSRFLSHKKYLFSLLFQTSCPWCFLKLSVCCSKKNWFITSLPPWGPKG